MQLSFNFDEENDLWFEETIERILKDAGVEPPPVQEISTANLQEILFSLGYQTYSETLESAPDEVPVGVAKIHARNLQSLVTALTGMKFAQDNELLAAAILLSLPDHIKHNISTNAEIMLNSLAEDRNN